MIISTTAVLIISAVVPLIITLAGIGIKVATANNILGAIEDFVDIDNIKQVQGFDETYVSLVGQATGMIANFMQYAILLITLGAFLCFIFNAVKLWSGTAEFKKIYVDSIIKCAVIAVLINIYPNVVNKTITLATSLGIEASGGKEHLEECFASLAKKVQTIFDEGTKVLIEGAKDDNGQLVISESLLKQFMKVGLTEDEAKAYLQTKGVQVANTSSGNRYLDKIQKKKERSAKSKFKSQAEMNKYMKQSLKIIDALSEILTGDTLVDKETGQVDRVAIMSMGDEALNKVFYNPYITNTSQTNMLSTSAMIKTAIIIQEICSSGALSSIDNGFSGTNKKSFWNISDAFSSGDARLVVKIISHFVKYFMYNIFIVLAVILIMIEYCLSIIEFLIVAAVSALFIPLYFIDATKQYATNILKVIFSYFIKIMVTTMMTFFVMAMFINMGSKMCSMDISSNIACFYFIFNCLIGLTLVKAGGKVASAVISGNPSMGLGDFMNEVRSMGHGIHTGYNFGKGLAQDTVRAGSQAVSAGKKIGNTIATNKAANTATLEGQEAAAFQSRQAMQDMKARASDVALGTNSQRYQDLNARQMKGENLSEADQKFLSDAERYSNLENKMNRGEALSADESAFMNQTEGALAMTNEQIDAAATQAGKDYAKQARKDFNSNWMYNKLTGIDKPADSSNALRVGQMFEYAPGQYRQATIQDVQNAGKIGGQQFGEQAAQNAIKRNSRMMCGNIELPEPGH